MKTKRNRLLITLFLLGIFIFPAGKAYAAQTEETEITDGLLDEYHFTDVQKQLNEIFPNSQISLTDMLKSVMSGENEWSFSLLWDAFKGSLLGEIGNLKGIFISLLFIGIIAAIFTNFSGLFENHQIADISYYLMYLFLITILLRTFSMAMDTGKETIGSIVVFVKILIPVFYIALGMAGGLLSAAAFYQLVLILIFCVQSLLMTFVIPVIYSYVFLVVINGLSDDDRFSSMAEMLKKGIRYLLNLCITLVTGIGILQSMITPVIDSVKVGMVQKVASAIPGIGNIADSVTQMVLGSAVLIKNSVGVVFFLLLLFLCAAPVLKLLLMTFVLKGSAAVIGMVCDKRMARCAEQVGEGSGLLLKTVITAMALFLISIAIVVISTSKGY